MVQMIVEWRWRVESGEGAVHAAMARTDDGEEGVRRQTSGEEDRHDKKWIHRYRMRGG